MRRLKPILTSLPFWVIVIWLVYGFGVGVIRSGGKNAPILAIGTILGIAIFVLAKRWLGLKQATRNRDLFTFLALPFAQIPKEIKIAARIRNPGKIAAGHPISAEFSQAVSEKMCKKIQEDMFICSRCGRRKSEFMATLDSFGSSDPKDIMCRECAEQLSA